MSLFERRILEIEGNSRSTLTIDINNQEELEKFCNALEKNSSLVNLQVHSKVAGSAERISETLAASKNPNILEVRITQRSKALQALLDQNVGETMRLLDILEDRRNPAISKEDAQAMIDHLPAIVDTVDRKEQRSSEQNYSLEIVSRIVNSAKKHSLAISIPPCVANDLESHIKTQFSNSAKLMAQAIGLADKLDIKLELPAEASHAFYKLVTPGQAGSHLSAELKRRQGNGPGNGKNTPGS